MASGISPPLISFIIDKIGQPVKNIKQKYGGAVSELVNQALPRQVVARDLLQAHSSGMEEPDFDCLAQNGAGGRKI